MAFINHSRSRSRPLNDNERPSKRISTPAGRRLSVVLDTKRSRSRSPAKPAINVMTTSTYCNDPTHQHIEPEQHGYKAAKKSAIVSVLSTGRINDTPRESDEHQRQTPNGSNLSVSVWSDRDAEKFDRLRRRNCVTIWGWKKVALIAAIVVALVIALAVGLAVGLKPKASKSSSPQSAANSGSARATQTTNSPSKPTSTLTPSAPPPNFPVGSFSLVTFLDTVTTNCTSDPSTWTCAPFTNYYTDPQKALTVLNWQISGTSGSYKISSLGQDATFGTTFQNEDLELLDAGDDQERYRFQISRSKTVNMTGSIGNQNGDFTCDFGATNMQAFLYTKMQRTYPSDTIAVGNLNNPAWPYAVRVEQTVAGGQNVPACKTSSGTSITDGLQPQDPSTLCSCLYRNWTPTT